MIQQKKVDGHTNPVNDECVYSSKNPQSLSQSDFISDKQRIEREIFFACECSGALVQDALCTVCKKTLSRICVDCSKVKSVGDHRKCLNIILVNMKKNSDKVMGQ